MTRTLYICPVCHAQSDMPPHGLGGPCPFSVELHTLELAVLEAKRDYYLALRTSAETASWPVHPDADV